LVYLVAVLSTTEYCWS